LALSFGDLVRAPVILRRRVGMLSLELERGSALVVPLLHHRLDHGPGRSSENADVNRFELGSHESPALIGEGIAPGSSSHRGSTSTMKRSSAEGDRLSSGRREHLGKHVDESVSRFGLVLLAERCGSRWSDVDNVPERAERPTQMPEIR
jgi:hypothetical protein